MLLPRKQTGAPRRSPTEYADIHYISAYVRRSLSRKAIKLHHTCRGRRPRRPALKQTNVCRGDHWSSVLNAKKQKCNALYPQIRHIKRSTNKSSVLLLLFFRKVLASLRVILSGVRPRFHLRFARCCFTVRLRYAPLRMTRADAVETRRANSNAVRISQGY